MRKVLMVVALAAGMTMGTANAQGFDASNVYAGGGIGFNSLSGFDDATGFQFFGGYKLDMVNLDPVGLSVEAGYMTTGDFKYEECLPFFGCDSYSLSANGIWATAVFDCALTRELSALGRVGLDFGDDDGLMFVDRKSVE